MGNCRCRNDPRSGVEGCRWLPLGGGPPSKQPHRPDLVPERAGASGVIPLPGVVTVGRGVPPLEAAQSTQVRSILGRSGASGVIPLPGVVTVGRGVPPSGSGPIDPISFHFGKERGVRSDSPPLGGYRWEGVPPPEPPAPARHRSQCLEGAGCSPRTPHPPMVTFGGREGVRDPVITDVAISKSKDNFPAGVSSRLLRVPWEIPTGLCSRSQDVVRMEAGARRLRFRGRRWGR